MRKNAATLSAVYNILLLKQLPVVSYHDGFDSGTVTSEDKMYSCLLLNIMNAKLMCGWWW